MNITLKQLRVFCAVYELRSFTMAAELMHLTQSAVSKLCAELEEETGVPLFERSTRRVVPLDSATGLYEHAQTVLGTLRMAERDLQGLRGLEHGAISLSCSPMMAYGLLRPVVAAFARHHPAVTIDMHECSTDESIEHVRIGRVDFALVSAPDVDPQLSLRIVRREPVLMVCEPGHPLADSATVSWQQVGQQRHVLIRNVYSIRRMMDRMLAQHGGQVQATVQVGNLASALGLVREGLGVTVIPAYAVQFARDIGLAAVPVSSARSQYHEISLLTRRESKPTVAAQAFLQEMDRQLTKLD